MFGEQLSEETIAALDGVLHIDREKIRLSDVDMLRRELEVLYDMYKGSIFQNSLQLYVDGEEIDVFSNIQDTYNMFMNDYETIIDKKN